MTSPDSKTVLSSYVDAVQSGDTAAISECFADDAVWQLDGELPISGTWRGRDAIVNEFLATAMSYYEPGSASFEIARIVAEGEHAVMQWTSRARTTRGEPYENRCIGVFTVRDGKIARVHEYMDTLYAHQVAFAQAAA
jgi:ketosteroid isomerase-like protein